MVVVNTYDKQETGVHGQRVAIADGDGNAVFRGIPSTVEKLAAFEIDPRSGAIHAAPDLAKRASQHHGKPLPNGYLGAAATRSINIRTIVLFKTRGREIYSLISPRSLLGYGGPTVMDQGGAEPRQFGFLLSKYPEEPAGVLFGPALGGEENRLRFFFGGLLEQRLLLLNSKGHGSEEEARGIGYSMGEEALTRLTEKAARDMWRLDEQRLVKLREHSISSRSLERLHQGAGELLDEAAEAAAELRWDRYVARAREALGLDARVYPRILKTLNDVIKGMVFFLALVVPAAFFGYVIPCIAGFFYLRHPGKQMVGHVPGGRPEVDGPRRRGRGAVARGPSPGDAGSLAGMGRAVDLVVPLLPRPESDDGLPQRDPPPPVVGSRAARVPDGAGAAAHD